jgi:hypothetical protein
MTTATFPSTALSSATDRGSLLRAIGYAGLAVGVLDSVDGVAYFGLTTGANPIQVLQYIASGALGEKAFSGGLATAALGAGFHFFLAYAFTAVIVTALQSSRAIREHATAAGLAWGAFVWALMNLVVLPMSAVAAAPLTLIAIVHGVVGHAIFVGLAASIVGRRVLDRAAPSA